MKYLTADGLRVKVDDADYPELAKFIWHIKWRTPNHPYVYRYEKRPVGHRLASSHRKVRLHKQLLNPPDGLSVDHRDRDPLNNTRKNLRLATPQQQACNAYQHKKKLYKGVTKTGLIHGKYQCNVPWRARIRVNGELKALGHFATPEAAAHAYNKAAKHYFGEFACLNIIRRKR